MKTAPNRSGVDSVGPSLPAQTPQRPHYLWLLLLNGCQLPRKEIPAGTEILGPTNPPSTIFGKTSAEPFEDWPGFTPGTVYCR